MVAEVDRKFDIDPVNMHTVRNRGHRLGRTHHVVGGIVEHAVAGCLAYLQHIQSAVAAYLKLHEYHAGPVLPECGRCKFWEKLAHAIADCARPNRIETARECGTVAIAAVRRNRLPGYADAGRFATGER